MFHFFAFFWFIFRHKLVPASLTTCLNGDCCWIPALLDSWICCQVWRALLGLTLSCLLPTANKTNLYCSRSVSSSCWKRNTKRRPSHFHTVVTRCTCSRQQPRYNQCQQRVIRKLRYVHKDGKEAADRIISSIHRADAETQTLLLLLI